VNAEAGVPEAGVRVTFSAPVPEVPELVSLNASGGEVAPALKPPKLKVSDGDQPSFTVPLAPALATPAAGPSTTTAPATTAARHIRPRITIPPY
jgi:hypothetical protein